MRLVVQRVRESKVVVEGRIAGAIGPGLMVLAGFSQSDTRHDVEYCATKLLGLRILSDEEGRMNRSVADVGGAILVVSQFTLYGDCRKGRRPSFDEAAAPQEALALYNYFVDELRRGPVPIQTGIFQAHMEVHLVNDGPVTLWIDSADRTKK